MRPFSLAFLVFISGQAVLAQESSYRVEVMRDQPLAYLPLDVKAASGNQVLDLVGEHHGNIAGELAPCEGVVGIGGQAAAFDGRTSVVTIVDDVAFKLDSLSVELWIRTKQSFDAKFWPGSATLISKATPGAGTSDWTINAASPTDGQDQGRLLAQSGPAGKPKDLYLWSPADQRLNDGVWHHIVWTREANGLNRLFLDGKLAAQGSDGGGEINNDRSIQIGGDTIHDGARYFAGQIDEVAIYSKPLTSQRIAAHFAAATVEAKLPPAATRTVDFITDIQPLLKRKCFECHGPGETEGGLSLATSTMAMEGGDGGTVIESGSSVTSRLIHFVAGIDPDSVMPPLRGTGFQPVNENQKSDMTGWKPIPRDDEPLTRVEIGLLRAWIDQGAKWPTSADVADPKAERARSHWAFLAIESPKIPDVKNSAWVVNPIDAFVLAKLEKANLKPAKRADRTTLLRRATFDLIGLPPTPVEVESFLAAEDFETAYAKAIERLLDSPHYGERWGRHWLDIARYADSAGYELDSFYDHAWRYRDYVIKSLNDDKSFDQFIREQLAADELWPDDESLRDATGLLTIGPFRYEGGIDRPDVVRYERLTDLADTIGTAFLGLTVGCARCHTHKYDPISQKDYFGLQAILAPAATWNVKEKRRTKADDLKQSIDLTVKNLDTAPVTYVLRRGELSSPGATANPTIMRSLPGGRVLDESAGEAHRQRRTKLANWVVSRDNPLTSRVLANRIWQGHFGRSLVPTPDDFGMQGEPPTHPGLLDYLATELKRNGWKLKHLHRLIMTSNTYKMGNRGLGFQRVKNAREKHELEAYLTNFLPDDPQNRLLSQFPRRRMEAETIWDNLHAVSGTLNLQQFGPPVFPPIEKSALDSLLNTKWEVSKDERQWSRRGVYVVVRRSLRMPFFDTFNASDPSTSCVRRDVTVVSPQSLTLLNGAVAAKQARAFAERLTRECGDDPPKIVQRAWLLAFGRKVEADESKKMLEFLESQSLLEFCLALMNTNEFIYID